MPTSQVIEGLRNEGFLPVKAVEARFRDAGKAGFVKHEIRFRREDQLAASEAREIVMRNSHDGSGAYQMDAGIFRLVCSNGLVVGNTDHRESVRHSGNAVGEVIDAAFRVLDTFDAVDAEMDLMKSVILPKPLQLAFASAALEARFDSEEKPITPEQVLRLRRREDDRDDAWSTFNRIQENVVKGGQFYRHQDANGKRSNRHTRPVQGIDQSNVLNRALWKLATEAAKLAK